MDLSHKIEKIRKGFFSVTYSYTLDHTYDHIIPYYRQLKEESHCANLSETQERNKKVHIQFSLPSVCEETPPMEPAKAGDTTTIHWTARIRGNSVNDGDNYQHEENENSDVGKLQRSRSVMESRRKQTPHEAVRKESLGGWKGSERMLSRRNASTSEEMKGSITNLKWKLRTDSIHDWLLD